MILTIGSVNIDHVHRVTRHPAPGETVADTGYLRGLGGKGTNMSLAARLAGAEVRHAGAVGADGDWCRRRLSAVGIDVEDLLTVDAATGHAIIMVDDAGENVIVIHGGANRALTPDLIGRALGRAAPGDWLLLQNETNLVVQAAQQGRAAGLRVAFAAAPFEADAAAALVGSVDLLALNAVEARQLAEHVGVAVGDLDVPALLVTRGVQGAEYRTAGGAVQQPAFAIDAVDTTGAGDTFLGYFLAGLDTGAAPEAAMRRAAAAAAIQVTRFGAAEAIPSAAEVDAFLAEHSDA